ncbi:MAG TPA: T9SS type A sorting domain-containing protein, partial [Prolixibacteraceae bacterium]
NGDFSLPADVLEYKNVNNIPNWKTDTQSVDFNGRSIANEGPRKNDAVCWLWDETPGIYQVIGTVPSVSTKYDVNFDLSCFYTWWADYKSDFYVIFSSYSGDNATSRIPLDTIKVIFDCKQADWFKFTSETGSYVLPAASAKAGQHLVVEFKPKNSQDFAAGSSYTYFWLDNITVKSSLYTGLIEKTISNDIKIIAYNGQIRINGANKIKLVSIYDLTGRKVLSTRPDSNVLNVSQLSGFYIVVVDSDAGIKAQKVIF